MSKRGATEELERAEAKKKSKREAKQSKWRTAFTQYNNPRIKLAVAASLRDQLPIILVVDVPQGLAEYYAFRPRDQEIGELVLNVLECQYAYGHQEDNDDEHTKGDLASADHMHIVNALCNPTSMEDYDVSLIDVYFHTTIDQIGHVANVDEFCDLPPLLYFQPCYGYY